MTQQQNDAIEKYIKVVEELLEDKQKTEDLKNKLTRAIKMLEESNRNNADEHKEFRNMFNEIIFESSTSKSYCQRQNQYVSELIEREIKDVMKEVDSVKNRNFFEYAWEWMKKDLKYILLILSFLNINHIFDFVILIIERFYNQ